MNCLTDSCIPNYCCFIEWSCKNHVPICIKVQWNKFPFMSFEGWVHFTHLNIPKFSRAIHWSSSYKDSMRIKRYGNNFTCMTIKGWELFASDRTPYFSSVIKWTCTNFIAKRHIKGHTINSIFMALQRMNGISSGCIPQFTGSIIASS